MKEGEKQHYTAFDAARVTREKIAKQAKSKPKEPRWRKRIKMIQKKKRRLPFYLQ